MLKILVAFTVACFICSSASLVVATELATPKAASLQKVNFTAQKTLYSQPDRVSMPARDRAANPPASLKVMPESAQLVLLSAALLCFVVRASRRKV